MFSQAESFFNLLNRFSVWRNSKQPPSDVVGRFIRLFEAHGVSKNQIPIFFDHGLTLADVNKNQRLLDQLGDELLSDACKLFNIRRQWLDCADDVVYETNLVYKNLDEFSALVDQLLASTF